MAGVVTVYKKKKKREAKKKKTTHTLEVVPILGTGPWFIVIMIVYSGGENTMTHNFAL